MKRHNPKRLSSLSNAEECNFKPWQTRQTVYAGLLSYPFCPDDYPADFRISQLRFAKSMLRFAWVSPGESWGSCALTHTERFPHSHSFCKVGLYSILSRWLTWMGNSWVWRRQTETVCEQKTIGYGRFNSGCYSVKTKCDRHCQSNPLHPDDVCKNMCTTSWFLNNLLRKSVYDVLVPQQFFGSKTDEGVYTILLTTPEYHNLLSVVCTLIEVTGVQWMESVTCEWGFSIRTLTKTGQWYDTGGWEIFL